MTTTIVDRVFNGGGVTTAKTLTNAALGSLSVVAIALPGYVLAIFTIDRMGRWYMQVMGFSVCCVLFLAISFSYSALSGPQAGAAGNAGFVILFGEKRGGP